ncbi:MAG: GNAT family N-acetyltransferase [Lautropia sp.]
MSKDSKPGGDRAGADIERIERATLAAVPPAASIERDGWLLGFDPGTVGRARSAVPLRHDIADPALLPELEAEYLRRGLVPRFRLPIDAPAFDPVADRLRGAGYRPNRPTQVLRAPVAMLVAASDVADAGAGRGDGAPGDTDIVLLERSASDAWAAVYLGEGFDPVDGRSRVALLRRAAEACYAGIRLSRATAGSAAGAAAGELAAVGCACFAFDLLGIHGMRTRPALRGRGLARRLIAAMAGAASRRGIAEAYLQVDGDNPAQSLYARLGFAPAWRYVYWERPAATPAAVPAVAVPAVL